MSGQKQQKIVFKNEWHLYSAVAITAALSFIVIKISTGTSQTIGVAFSAIVACFLFASENWKNVSKIVHQWCIFFSVIASGMVGGILYFKNKK